MEDFDIVRITSKRSKWFGELAYILRKDYSFAKDGIPIYKLCDYRGETVRLKYGGFEFVRHTPRKGDRCKILFDRYGRFRNATNLRIESFSICSPWAPINVSMNTGKYGTRFVCVNPLDISILGVKFV